MMHAVATEAEALARAAGLLRWREAANLLAHQERRLRRLVAHAYRHVPYYRELLSRHGVAPAQVQTLDDLWRIPISTRVDLRNMPAEQVVAAGHDPVRMLRVQTSGSTGEPLVLYRTRAERRRQQLFWIRAQRMLGQQLGDRVVWISSVRASRPSGLGLVGKLVRRLGLQQSALEVSTPPDLLLRQLEQLRPAVVVAYPSMLARLGEARQGPNGPLVSPKFLLTGGESLTASRRSHIQATWTVPTFEVYSAFETSLIGWQCQETGLLHVSDDSVVLEVIRDGRSVAAGERGEAVVTSLIFEAMPLIRYRLGDLVTLGPSPCPCGRPFRTISAVQGRMLDLFRLPGGRLLHPYEILSDLKDDAFRWVRQYQLVQEAEDRIVFLMVPGPEFTQQRLAEFERRAARALGSNTQLQVALVDRIEPSSSGKFHLARTQLPTIDEAAAWHRSESTG